MVRVAADENLHMMFYRDIVAAALQVDPSAAVQAITEEVVGFDMPGVAIEGFTRKALQMARAGIYDLRIHHDEILWPLLRFWNLFALEGLGQVHNTVDDGSDRAVRLDLGPFIVGAVSTASTFKDACAELRRSPWPFGSHRL
jgi:acyl-[acyl-carrier-protein] desaturase